MPQFDNVSVIQQANIYFGGKVTSRTLMFADGSRKTLGIMLPGEYQFNTDEQELMEILSGKMEVKLPNADWQTITGGQSFEVPAVSTFQLKVAEVVDYCCSFISR